MQPLVLPVLALFQAAPAPPQRPDSLALARQYTVWFYTGEMGLGPRSQAPPIDP